MRTVFVLAVLVLFCACQSTAVKNESVQVAAPATQEVKANPVDGVYVFDSYRYKEEQLKHPDNVFKDVPAEDIDNVMKVFAPFQITIKKGTAAASFSNEVIRGSVKELSRSSQETRLQMKPTNEEHKNELLTLIITGDRLVLDPGKEEKDKMYYKRAGSL